MSEITEGVAIGLFLIGFVGGVVLFVTAVCLVKLFDIGREKLERVDRLMGHPPRRQRMRLVMFVGFIEVLGYLRNAESREEIDHDL